MTPASLPRPRARTGLRALLAVLSTAVLLGCAVPRPADHAAERPVLDLRRYFSGPLEGHGIVTDRGGHVVRRFVVKMVGRWDGDSGVLEEDFRYGDGTTERRVWRLTRTADGRYIGRADDVVGDARGEAAGNTLQWRYALRVPVDGRTWEVDFDDWMVLVDDKVLINRATMSKFGIRVGEVLLSMRRL